MRLSLVLVRTAKRVERFGFIVVGRPAREFTGAFIGVKQGQFDRKAVILVIRITLTDPADNRTISRVVELPPFASFFLLAPPLPLVQPRSSEPIHVRAPSFLIFAGCLELILTEHARRYEFLQPRRVKHRKLAIIPAAPAAATAT
jgi:hypothetical protein